MNSESQVVARFVFSHISEAVQKKDKTVKLRITEGLYDDTDRQKLIEFLKQSEIEYEECSNGVSFWDSLHKFLNCSTLTE